jgi:hypothetical protein
MKMTFKMIQPIGNSPYPAPYTAVVAAKRPGMWKINTAVAKAVRTSYGALEVRLPAGLKPAVQAHTSYGDIESDFPVLMKSRNQGALDGQPPGTPRINLQNQNGKIRVVGE